MTGNAVQAAAEATVEQTAMPPDEQDPVNQPANTVPPLAAVESSTADRHSLPRRDSAKDSTLSPLPDLGLQKVYPKLQLATPRLSSYNEAFATGMPFSYQDSAEELERLAANHETLLHHFTLRKRPSMSSPASGLQTAHSPSSAFQSRWSFSRSMKRVRRHFRDLGTNILDPIAPGSTFMICRQVVMMLVVIFELFFIPFSGLYLTDKEYIDNSKATVHRINVAVEAIMFTDCLLIFNTALHDTRRGHLILILRRSDIATRYLRESFVFDFLACLPLEICAVILSGNNCGPLIAEYPILFHIENTLRILRFRCISRTKKIPWLVDLAHSASSRGQVWLGVRFVVLRTMLSMTVWLVVISHYLTCIWHVITVTYVPVLTVDGDVLSAASPSRRRALVNEYFANLLDIITCTLGHADHTGVPIADAFQTLMIVIGVQLFAYMIGTLSVLVSNTSYSTHSKFQRKMQSLASKMEKMQLPVELQKRVQQYYAHLWAEYDTLSGDILDFSRDLTRPLALEVGLYRYMHLIMRVPFWSDCSPDFVSALILSLRVRVYLRDDYVVRRGEIGTEMFLIHRGVGERTGSRREAVRLTNGNFFAEVAILMDYKRVTSVRALTHMELCIMDRANFHKILARYHRERRRVISRIVRAGLENKDYPELWQDVVLIGARRNREVNIAKQESAGVAGSNQGAEDEELSPSAAAELLVSAMNLEESFHMGSSLVLNGSPGSTAKWGSRSHIESEDRALLRPTYSTRHTNNSSVSSNGRRLERLRRARTIVVRSQGRANRSHDDHPPGSPQATSSLEPLIMTPVHPRHEIARSGSNRSLQSGTSTGKSTERNGCRRNVNSEPRSARENACICSRSSPRSSRGSSSGSFRWRSAQCPHCFEHSTPSRSTTTTSRSSTSSCHSTRGHPPIASVGPAAITLTLQTEFDLASVKDECH